MKPNTPNAAMALWVIIRLEMERLFTSRQGWLYLTAFAFFWYLLLRYVIYSISNLVAQQGQSVPDFSGAIFSTYFNAGLIVFPLLCIFIAANQTGSDRERGTLRFITLRCSRAEIFFGRFLSQVFIHLILIIATMLSAFAVAGVKDGFSLPVLGNGVVMAINLALAVLPFIAMMALLSAIVKSPRKATVIAFLVWALASVIISGLSHYFPLLESLKLLVPGMQFDSLSNLEGAAMFSLAYIPLVQSAILLVTGYYVMKRASL